MNRDLAKRLVRLEARRADPVELLSDAALIAAIADAEGRLAALLGEGWEAIYRAELAETQPHLLEAWDAHRDTIRELETNS